MIAAWLLSGALCMVAATDDGAAKPPAIDRAEYEAAVAAAGRDAEAQVNLALWCEARGMAAERSKHLSRAVLLDPDNARARGLLGYVKHDGKWLRSQDVPGAVENSPEALALQREYLERRAKTGDDADDQYKLALWCEEKGLIEPMTAHLHRTLQLDPGREGAWRRLGFKKSGGRWVNPRIEAVLKAEREVQSKADRAWKPKLEKLRDALVGKDAERRDQAASALASITDPRAVPMLWQTFARGGRQDRQRVAVDVFSRIDAPDASTALATLAVFSPHADVRSDAATLVQRRDPREYAGLLASLIQDEVKYKVKPVEGPGSTGELLVEGEDANVRRLYRPLQAPMVQPGDQFGRNANGEVVLNRLLGSPYFGFPLSASTATAMATGRPLVGIGSGLGIGGLWSPPDNPATAVATLERAGVPAGLSQTVVDRIQGPSAADPTWGASAMATPLMQNSLQIPIQRMMAEAQASALVAREQLARDVADIESHNAPIRDVNERAVAILKTISGEDRGADRKQWMNWVLDLQGYAQPFRAPTGPTSTMVEDVPINFQPQAVPLTSSTVAAAFGQPRSTGSTVRQTSCFAAGTSVRTLRGDLAIEEVQPGDQVLSQDVTTGELSFKAVLRPVHNPPDWTYKIDLGAETVHPTGIHRFWKAGHGWIMARDVTSGDRLRTAGGVVKVVSAEREKLQPVFNLVLSGGDNYCVGSLGLIAHDDSLVEPVDKPFDGVPATAELVAASTANP